MGQSSVIYDDANLQRLFAEMDAKQRLKALKGAFRKEANRVRKTALNNLRGSIRTDRNMESGVRAIVFKSTAGFRVTIGTKKATKDGGKDYGFHKNRQGLKKPILIWAEEGTKDRHTKTKTRIFTRARKGHATGSMRRYGFMRKTLADVKDSITENMKKELSNNIEKIAEKYGCK